MLHPKLNRYWNFSWAKHPFAAAFTQWSKSVHCTPEVLILSLLSDGHCVTEEKEYTFPYLKEESYKPGNYRGTHGEVTLQQATSMLRACQIKAGHSEMHSRSQIHEENLFASHDQSLICPCSYSGIEGCTAEHATILRSVCLHARITYNQHKHMPIEGPSSAGTLLHAYIHKKTSIQTMGNYSNPTAQPGLQSTNRSLILLWAATMCSFPITILFQIPKQMSRGSPSVLQNCYQNSRCCLH